LSDSGFAKVMRAQLNKPKNNNYIKTQVTYKSGSSVHFNLPMNRYYMNEKKAPQAAEALYRRNNIRNKQDAYVIIRILKGKVLIEGLYVGGKDIESYF